MSALLLALFASVPLVAGQQLEIPANDGWVTDRAGFLSADEERALETLMEAYRAGSGQEIALLTVPDLGGRPIEEFALNVARSWKIGDRATSSGALLVVAKAEHALRIEVGRGLEGTLTDSISGRIIRDVIVPEFRAERYAQGLRRGIEAIHAALGGQYATPEQSSPEDVLGPVIALVFLLVIALLLRRGMRGIGGGTSALPWILASQIGSMSRSGGSFGGFSSRGSGGSGGGGGGFSGFGGGGGFSGGGASGRW